MTGPTYENKWDCDSILSAAFDTAQQALKTTDSSGSSGGSLPDTIYNGHVTVTTAGSAVSISSSSITLKKGITIKANTNNTGNIFVGNSSVDNTNGIEIEPGESIDISIDDLNKVYIDANNNNDGISYIGG